MNETYKTYIGALPISGFDAWPGDAQPHGLKFLDSVEYAGEPWTVGVVIPGNSIVRLVNGKDWRIVCAADCKAAENVPR